MSWVLWYLGIGLFLGLIRGVLCKSFWGVPVLMALWLPFLLAIVMVAVLFLLVDSLQAEEDQLNYVYTSRSVVDGPFAA